MRAGSFGLKCLVVGSRLLLRHFSPDYGTLDLDFLGMAPKNHCCGAIMGAANQKANGSRSGAISNAPMALTLSSDVAS